MQIKTRHIFPQSVWFYPFLNTDMGYSACQHLGVIANPQTDASHATQSQFSEFKLRLQLLKLDRLVEGPKAHHQTRHNEQAAATS